MVNGMRLKRRVWEWEAVFLQFKRHAMLSSVVAVLALAGCAADGKGMAGQRELLQPWIEITGGPMNVPSGSLATDYIALNRPTVLSVSGNDLYLIDAGLRSILRYDGNTQSLTPFAVNVPYEDGMGIYAAENRTVYISLPSAGKVLHLAWDGSSLPSFSAPGELARPIAVAVDERAGRILVADELYNQIVVFNDAGVVLSIIRAPQLQSISALAAGPDGAYAIDGLSKRVVVLSRNGMLRSLIEQDFKSNPGSLAVSKENLIFLSDRFDNSVKVFHVGLSGKSELVGQIDGMDISSGIGGVAVQDNMLYVADSVGGRILTYLLDISVMWSRK